MTKKELEAIYGTQAQHIINHMEKMGKKDIEELKKRDKPKGKWVCKEGVCQLEMEETNE